MKKHIGVLVIALSALVLAGCEELGGAGSAGTNEQITALENEVTTLREEFGTFREEWTSFNEDWGTYREQIGLGEAGAEPAVGE